MMQQTPYAGFERLGPATGPAAPPAGAYAGFERVGPPVAPASAPAARPSQPRPQATPMPSSAPLNALGITDEEELNALTAPYGSREEAIRLQQERMAADPNYDPGMAPAQPALPPANPSSGFELPEGVVDWNTLTDEQRRGLTRGTRIMLPQREGETFRQVATLAADLNAPSREDLPGDVIQQYDGFRTREGQMADVVGAVASGAAEQYPFLDEAVTGLDALVNRRSFSESRDEYRNMVEALNQQQREARNIGGVGGFVGALALPAGGSFVGRGVDNADRIRRAALASGLVGSVYGAGGSEGSLTERGQAGALAALLSAGTGGVLQSGVNRLSRPTADTAQRRMSRQGQELTMGQMFGGGLQRLEDAFTSIPLAGDLVRNRQRDTLASFDTLATNTALRPLGEALESSAGRQGVRDADAIISGAYTRALEPVTAFNPADETLTAALATARSPERLTADVSASLNSTLDNIFSQAPGEIDGQTWKRIDSQLAAAARQAEAGAATRPEMTALNERLRQARTAWRDALGRVDENALAGVMAADAAEAQYRLVRQASSDVASAGRGGDASPATLNRAVAQSGSNRRFARGENLMQDLTDDAMQVLPRTVPDSGTPLRSLVTGAGIGGGLSAIGTDPAALALGAALTGGVSLGYTRPAQQLANRLYRASDTGGTTRDVAGLAEALRRAPVGVALVSPDAQNSTQARRQVRQ